MTLELVYSVLMHIVINVDHIAFCAIHDDERWHPVLRLEHFRRQEEKDVATRKRVSINRRTCARHKTADENGRGAGKSERARPRIALSAAVDGPKRMMYASGDELTTGR